MLRMPINLNVVLVGFRPGTVDPGRILGSLPATSQPFVREESFYGIDTPVGLQYDYHYRSRYAGAVLDDAFFRHLESSGHVGGPEYTHLQYNQQVHRSLDVGPQVRYLDARDTEKWLEDNVAPRGVLHRPTTPCS